MRRSLIAAIVVVVVLTLPVALRAHQGHLHKALGTITSVQGELMDVRTTDGKQLTVKLDSKTTITRGKKKLDTAALKVGERISVDYMEEKKIMMARAIKLATTTAKK
jgi:hypothetical protein